MGGFNYRECLAELVGTFMLVFVGTGAIIINDLSAGAITHPGVALSFGLVVSAVIYCYGDISGAHINPAVTLGFYVAKRFPREKIKFYVIAQHWRYISIAAIEINF